MATVIDPPPLCDLLRASRSQCCRHLAGLLVHLVSILDTWTVCPAHPFTSLVGLFLVPFLQHPLFQAAPFVIINTPSIILIFPAPFELQPLPFSYRPRRSMLFPSGVTTLHFFDYNRFHLALSSMMVLSVLKTGGEIVDEEAWIG